MHGVSKCTRARPQWNVFEMLEAIDWGVRGSNGGLVSMGQVLRLCLFAKPTMSQEGLMRSDLF